MEKEASSLSISQKTNITPISRFFEPVQTNDFNKRQKRLVSKTLSKPLVVIYAKSGKAEGEERSKGGTVCWITDYWLYWLKWLKSLF